MKLRCREKDRSLVALDSSYRAQPSAPTDKPHQRLLLANLSETLAAADAMASNLAFDLEGSCRHIALGIQQLIELSSLLANRVLDTVDPR
ncbi:MULTISPECIES: DUF6124 family protein [Pseudomonas]|uniref:DUF6124 family protein n=1 Tax=Pseudomonas fluorescens TaxID=294 RepID=UPI0010579FCB